MPKLNDNKMWEDLNVHISLTLKKNLPESVIQKTSCDSLMDKFSRVVRASVLEVVPQDVAPKGKSKPSSEERVNRIKKLIAANKLAKKQHKA